MSTIINLNSLDFTYGNNAPILGNVNLEIKKGTFHFLTGKSGAGKSTLLKLMYFDALPSRGKAYIFNKEIRNYTRGQIALARQRISVIFQDHKLLPHLSAFDNVALPLRIKGESDSVVIKKVEQMLSWVGLRNYMESLPDTLSGGQQQRISIARAVITSPTLILADEPTGSVDDLTGAKIMALFSQLHKQGTTIIMATHNNNLVITSSYPELYIHNRHVLLK